MTIKTIGLSALTAAIISTSAIAGTITNTGTLGLIGSEAASLANINVGSAFGAIGEVTYVPSDIPATSLKNPIFKFTFGNGTGVVLTDANASVFVFNNGNSDNNESNMTASNWTQIANNMQISGSNTEIASFNAINSNIYAYNGKTYIVASHDGNNSGATNLVAADINISVAQNSTSNLTLLGELYSGDSQSQADVSTATAIAEVAAEYVGSVTLPLNARIDASDSFKSFYDQHITNQDLQDDVTWTLTRKTTLTGASLNDATANVNLTFDQNLTVNDNTGTDGGEANTVGSVSSNDENLTGIVTLTGSGTADVSSFKLDLAGNTAAIPKTSFDLHAYVTSGTTNFDIISKSTANAGSWTIYGYNAQIPNVSGLSTHDTTMKFTNRSTLDTNIYFTLIDPDGTVVSLDSVTNTSLAALSANETGTYKASALIALITDADFDATSSFSVEVSIPTTPTSVYGMASFKNTTLGQFKDLPVYNSGMSY